jgi:thiamine biosynthesis protein ThiI
MFVTNEVCKYPVYRPLIGFDKQEIIERALEIGTYETSILPFEDCCTIFVAKHPETKPRLNIIKKNEENLVGTIEELVQTAIDTTETILVQPE